MQDILNQFNLQALDSVTLQQDKAFRDKWQKQREELIITKHVKKINKRNREQERIIAITNKQFYNLKSKSIQRVIALGQIYAITISKTSYEFVIHVPDEYDYRYVSEENRDTIIQYLAIVYKFQVGQPLKAYFVDNDNLEQFTFQENGDKNKSRSLHPKVPLKLLPPESFQLDYCNMIDGQKITVLFIANPYQLRVRLQDYSKHLVIAQGSLGKVYLIQDKRSKLTKYLVLKTISKQSLQPQYEIDVDLMEFLLKNYKPNPFVVPLEMCIAYYNKILFFFKFMTAGDLYQHLREVNQFNELQAKMIFCQIAMGLFSLHEKGIIFGDLKPENVLMDDNGYVCLTDFGYGKLRLYSEMKKSKIIYFTLEYCSPEYLKNGELTRMSDWYSLGILLYEMIIGIPPYYNPVSKELTFKLILAGDLHFPKNQTFTKECKDMIMKLLQLDTSSRLGFHTDFKEIQQHPWVADVRWDDLANKKLSLPYVPSTNGQQINSQYFSIEALQEEDKQNW